MGELNSGGATVGVTPIGQGFVSVPPADVTPLEEGLAVGGKPTLAGLVGTEVAAAALAGLVTIVLVVGQGTVGTPVALVSPVPGVPMVLEGVVVVVWLGIAPAGVVVCIPVGVVV